MRHLLATVNWINASGGAWEVPGNWSTGTLPGVNDDVVIDLPGSISITHNSGNDSIRSLASQESLVLPGGSLSVSAASTLNGPFSLSGGTLAGTGQVTVNGGMTWTGGTMSGSGTTTIAAGAQLTLTSGNNKFLSQRTLSNAGSVTWSGTGWLYVDSGALIDNQAGATFDAQNDANIQHNGGAAATLVNAGTFRKSAGTGTTTVSGGVAFHSTGTVAIQSGTLNIAGGGTSNTSWTPSTGATLLWEKQSSNAELYSGTINTDIKLNVSWGVYDDSHSGNTR